jgi:hypothetical protein
MVRLTTANGLIEFEDSEMTERLLRNQQSVEAAAQAEAIMLSVVYRLEGEPDADVPFQGLLTKRLQLSNRTLREHITCGRLGYYCGAKKAYRVTERAVRRFEAGLPPLAPGQQ